MTIKKSSIISMLFVGFLVIFGVFPQARPSYGIEWIEDYCTEWGLDFCAKPVDSAANAAAKKRTFTENERKLLTSLLQRQQELNTRSQSVERRERQLRTLQEDVQTQISQLERLQQQVTRDIEAKRAQDNQQFQRIILLYEKMDPEKAAESIAQLESKVAVQLLMQLKDKQASTILAQMDAQKAAQLIGEMASKR